MAKNVKKKPLVSKATFTATYENIGHLAFLAGIAIAVLSGLFSDLFSGRALMSTLFLLGLIVGILNIRLKETTPFLVATASLILAGVVNLSQLPIFGIYIRSVLNNIVVFVVPAAVIASLRAIWLLAEKR